MDDENDDVGVTVHGGMADDDDGPAAKGAVVNGGLGERICESLLGEALRDGVAETRLLQASHTTVNIILYAGVKEAQIRTSRSEERGSGR